MSEGHTIGDLSILHSSAPQNLEAIYSGMTRRGARTGTPSALACEELSHKKGRQVEQESTGCVQPGSETQLRSSWTYDHAAAVMVVVAVDGFIW